MSERSIHEKYLAVFSPTRAVEGLTREQWLEKIPNADAVIVLGSGLAKSKTGGSRINMHGKMRALAAAELFNAGKAKHIIVTGGVPIDGVHEISMAWAEREYLQNDLKIPDDSIARADAKMKRERRKKAIEARK